MAISGRQLRFRRWLSHIPIGYCEIAPQGHFLALRAQGATAPSGPRNDTSGAITILTPACPLPCIFYHTIIVFIDDILVSLKITIGFFRSFPV